MTPQLADYGYRKIPPETRYEDRPVRDLDFSFTNGRDIQYTLTEGDTFTRGDDLFTIHIQKTDHFVYLMVREIVWWSERQLVQRYQLPDSPPVEPENIPFGGNLCQICGAEVTPPAVRCADHLERSL